MSTDLDIDTSETKHELKLVADGVAGVVGAKLTTYLNLYVIEHNLGWVFNADTDFVIGKKADGTDLRRRPDAAFCSFATLAQPPRAVVPVPPDLAIEVTSSRDEIDDTDKKLLEYRQVKIRLVWVVRPVQQVVEIYRDGKVAGMLSLDG